MFFALHGFSYRGYSSDTTILYAPPIPIPINKFTRDNAMSRDCYISPLKYEVDGSMSINTVLSRVNGQ